MRLEQYKPTSSKPLIVINFRPGQVNPIDGEVADERQAGEITTNTYLSIHQNPFVDETVVGYKVPTENSTIILLNEVVFTQRFGKIISGVLVWNGASSV